ncbi:MAG: formyltetrahydrofolate deformylase [Thermoplasmata archaeon]|nr:formyltetrahydrofolate deformylase [Thermoplasmata archaeon]
MPASSPKAKGKKAGTSKSGKSKPTANPSNRQRAHATVIGQDKAGVIAKICAFLFDNGGNIEELDQHVTRGLFTMHLEVSWPQGGRKASEMQAGLQAVVGKLGMELEFRPVTGASDGPTRLGLLVTREEHAPRAVLEACRDGALDCEVAVVLGNHEALRGLAKEFGVPFQHVPDQDKPEHEAALLRQLKDHGVDLVVLARYMRILSPNFVWRFPNRILNIHPSLLPAFPGAVPYRQALQRGVRVAGVTAHLVTVDLDQGPILAQESFNVGAADELAEVVKRGRDLEAKVLVDAVRLWDAGTLEVGWGRTWAKD